MNPIIVTSYVDPDLDGTACAYAYAEFLKHTNPHVQAMITGTPYIEAQ